MAAAPGRDRLLDAAEKLFAEQGIEATSARAINAAADLSPAALHYHFGNKDKLVEEVMHRRMGHLNERRAVILEEAQRQGRAMDAYQLAALIVLPLADFALGGDVPCHAYVRFLSRLYTERAALTVEFMEKNFHEGVRQFDEMILAVADGLTMDQVRIRRVIGGETAVHFLAHICELFEDKPNARQQAEPLIRSLIEFVAAGLVAPAR